MLELERKSERKRKKGVAEWERNECLEKKEKIITRKKRVL